VSGRHSKPTFLSLHSNKIKAAGGVLAGAALAGGIAASAAIGTPGTAQQFATQAALADVVAAAGKDTSASRHEAHQGHAAHSNHATRASGRSGNTEASASKSSKSSKDKTKSSRDKTPGRSQRRVTAQQVIKLAKSQIGDGENRSGVSKFNKWFMDDSRALTTLKRDGGSLSDYKEAAWCDMFVSWIGDKLGISRTMGFDAYTSEHAQWFKDHGRWGDKPRPGAVAFFSWNGDTIDDIDHVGFTIKDNGDGTIRTIEGNTHNTVAIRTRDKSNVVGYGYPHYRK
jgi:hypothetical protein